MSTPKALKVLHKVIKPTFMLDVGMRNSALESDRQAEELCDGKRCKAAATTCLKTARRQREAGEQLAKDPRELLHRWPCRRSNVLLGKR